MHTYQLNIPSEWKIHPVFHVSLLSDAIKDSFPECNMIKLPPVEIDREDEYKVEQILDL
jgi:hypothetical protein